MPTAVSPKATSQARQSQDWTGLVETPPLLLSGDEFWARWEG